MIGREAGVARSQAVPTRRSKALALPPPALWPAVALLVLYAAFYVQAAGRLVGFPFDVDQGEGYDAWSAWLVTTGQLPYTDNEAFPYYSSNYPPVWSWLVSLPMHWTGPGLAPARAISAAAGALAALAVGLAARRQAGNTLAGFLAGGLFLASPYVFHTAPLARVNSTELLLALVGLSLFEAPTRARVILGSVALLCAVFTKQTAIDAIVAGLLYCWVVSRTLTGLAAALVGGFGLLGLALLTWATGGAFWLNAFAGNVNPYDLGQLASYGINFLAVHCVVLALAVVEARSLIARRRWSPWVFYLLVSATLALAAGKWGAGESYFLGTLAAACVLAAGPIARLLDGHEPTWRRDLGRRWQERRARLAAAARRSSALPRPSRSRAAGRRDARSARHVLGAVLLAQALILAHGPLSQSVAWLPDRGFQASLLGSTPSAFDWAAGEEIVAVIRASDRPSLVEDPSFAVAAGKPVVGNATHLRNLHGAGLWQGAALVADIEARRFGVVVLNAQLYPAPVLAAIGRSYFIDRAVTVGPATYQIFLPGDEQRSSVSTVDGR